MSIFKDAKSVLAAAGVFVTSLFVMFKGILNNAPPGTEQWNVPELLMLMCVVIFLLLVVFYRGRLTRSFVKRATWTTIAALMLGVLCYAGLIWQSSVNVFDYRGSRYIRGGLSEQGEANVRRHSGSLESAINSLGGLPDAKSYLWTTESERRAKYYLLGWYFSSSLFLAAAVLSAALLATILWRERGRQE